jgi:hypothetical protein
MGKFISKTASILFHPLILPALSILVLFNSGSYIDFLPYQAKKIILLIVIVSTFILPLTFVPFYIFQNIIKSIQMENHKERLNSLFYFILSLPLLLLLTTSNRYSIYN